MTSPPTLRHLAEAATPGPWEVNPSDKANVTGPFMEATREQHERNAAFIAALSPDVVLALLNERDALRVALENLRIDANRLCDRQLGGTYEDDCRRSIQKADEALRR